MAWPLSSSDEFNFFHRRELAYACSNYVKLVEMRTSGNLAAQVMERSRQLCASCVSAETTPEQLEAHVYGYVSEILEILPVFKMSAPVDLERMMLRCRNARDEAMREQPSELD